MTNVSSDYICLISAHLRHVYTPFHCEFLSLYLKHYFFPQYFSPITKIKMKSNQLLPSNTTYASVVCQIKGFYLHDKGENNWNIFPNRVIRSKTSDLCVSRLLALQRKKFQAKQTKTAVSNRVLPYDYSNCTPIWESAWVSEFTKVVASGWNAPKHSSPACADSTMASRLIPIIVRWGAERRKVVGRCQQRGDEYSVVFCRCFFFVSGRHTWGKWWESEPGERGLKCKLNYYMYKYK